MDKRMLCIATMTWARSEVEELLLKQSLEELAKLNVNVFITDGGSNDKFLDFIRGLPNFKLLPSSPKGLQAQIASSLLAAFESATPFILYTEPDKKQFFSQSLAKFIVQAIANETTGVIMASRTPQAFESFPSFQQMTETTINNCCSEITGKTLDYTFGPFILHRSLLPHVNALTKDIGWGWRPYIFIMAKRLGYNIDAIEGDFICPVDQQADNTKERIYRMKQLEQNIRGIIISAEPSLQ